MMVLYYWLDNDRFGAIEGETSRRDRIQNREEVIKHV